jgi:APA family basic amino acid/polyamine antiporter
MSAPESRMQQVADGFKRGTTRFGYRKNVDRLLAEASDKKGLAKTLSAWNLVMLGVAGIIGGGIFVLVGSGIVKAGIMVVPAFVVAALICAVAGFAYAELAAAIPASGSAFAYIYTAMGELPGWMVAWALILEYAVGAVSVAVACRNNLLAVITQFGHLFNPADAVRSASNPNGLQYFANPENPILYGLTHSPLEAGSTVNAAGDAVTLHGFVNLPSILIVVLVTALLVKGTKESARFTSVLVVAKVAILLFAIGVAFSLFNPANFAQGLPFYSLPHGENCYGSAAAVCQGTTYDGNGNVLTTVYNTQGLWDATKAVFGAAAIMFFAYIGFDSVSTTAEETKNPKKDLPVGILGSLAISTLLYILAAGALVGASHWSMFVGDSLAAKQASGEPFGYVFEQHHALEINGFSLGALLVRLGALIGTTSVLLVLILGGVRVFFNMSRDGLLPGWMSTVGPRGNPAKTTWFYGAFTLVFAGLLTLDAAVELVNIGTLAAFFMVVVATWLFRLRRPDVERPFRMPMWSILTRNGRPILPMFVILGLLGILALALSLDPFTLTAAVTWAGIGLLVYAFYGVRHSKEAHHRHVPARTEVVDPFLKGRPAGTTRDEE